MGTLDQPNQKERILLTRFLYSDSTVARTTRAYCTYSRAISFTFPNEDLIGIDVGAISIPCPSLDMKVPENTGVFDDLTAEVVLPRITPEGVVDPFVDEVSRGEPFAPIDCTLYVGVLAPGVLLGGGARVVDDPHGWKGLFRGKVASVIRNYQGREDSVLFRVQSIKSDLRVPLGLIASAQCGWTLGGNGCRIAVGGYIAGPDINTFKTTGQVTVISGKHLQIESIGALVSALDNKYFHRGYLELNKLKIDVRDYQIIGDHSAQFDLVREPPASWLTKVITLVPGCDKSIQTCRSRWNNEQNFSGFGYAMPAYNPIIEDSPEAP